MTQVLENDYFDVKLAVSFSFLAWPIMYFAETITLQIDEDKRTLTLLCIGLTVLTSATLALRILSRKKSWINHVFGLFALTCMIDLIICLDKWGWIRGFGAQYLIIGEPYLASPWGCVVMLYDATFFYIKYLILIYCISNNKSWRDVGIYWAAAIINCMIVLLFGMASGKHAPTFCTFINVPYTLFPVYCAIRLFSKEKGSNWSEQQLKSNGVLFDATVAIGLVYSIWIAFSKGILSIGSQFKIFQDILSHERALLDDDPAPFAKIQSFVYLFYSTPIMIVSLIYSFSKRKPQIIWELALINGGLMLPAQLCFIGSALYYQTPIDLKSDPFDWVFWINNLVLLLAPQLFIWSLYRSNIGDSKQVKARLYSHTSVRRIRS